jgi:hypothetical protein
VSSLYLRKHTLKRYGLLLHMARGLQLGANPRVGGSIPPLGTIPISFLFMINDLEKVGQSWILWWDSHLYPSRSHFSIALAASFFWRTPFV